MTTLQLSPLPLDNLTSSPQDSPVKMFQVPTPTGEGWKVNEAGCSLKLSDYLGQFSRDSLFLKTFQPSLTGDLIVFSGNLPKAVLMQNGKLFHRPQWVRHTYEKGFSLLPTPKASDRLGIVHCKEGQTQHLSASVLSGNKTRILNPQFVAWMMGLPEDW